MKIKNRISPLLVLLLLTLSASAYANQLSCEIYDLATGDVLAKSGSIPLTSEVLRNEEPFRLTLEHILMRADFQLKFLNSNSDVLDFHIRTQEVSNSEFGKFLISTSDFKTGKTYELGRVFTEITGYGDNTMSSCKLFIEK